MKQLIIFILGSLLTLSQKESGLNDRVIVYQDEEYNTSFDVPDHFIGRYEGRKAGYLQLNADGTGEYRYDIFGMAPASCKRGPIMFIWGFLLDEKGQIVKKERDYGFSYPILLESTGATSFQGCRTKVMQDFILQRGEILHVSSSDDWEKAVK